MPSEAQAKLWLEDLEAMHLKLSKATAVKPVLKAVPKSTAKKTEPGKGVA